MKILLMGGTGALGSSLAPLLARDLNNKVYVTSRRTTMDEGSIHYICGNAKDLGFLMPLLHREQFDIVVDFMLYSVDEFRNRVNQLLSSTKRYIFFSSSRVYAESDELVTEVSSRLLDVTNDQAYLEDFEYSLYKAAEEDILKHSSSKNWTIIRPYKIYSNERLQLGVFEKEQWADRAFRGKKVVFLKDSLLKYTSLTYTGDAAHILEKIVYSDNMCGRVYQIANPEQTTWKDIISIYQLCFQKEGLDFQVVCTDNYDEVSKVFNNRYRIKYDGLLNRRFSDSNIQNDFGQFKWTPVADGLMKCTTNYIRNHRRDNTQIDYAMEGFFDRITGEKEPVLGIVGMKNKMKYILYRYLPYRVYLNLKDARKKE